MAPPKPKGQKMALGEFLTDASLGSWADEMEDTPIPGLRPGYGGSSGGDRQNSTWGGAGDRGTREDRGDRSYPSREQLPLPNKPPYTVHLGNMSFDATESDIQALFSGCEVTSVRIVEDKMDRKPKGFGYAEFASLDGLKKALELNQTQFQGRNIRISVAEPQKDRQGDRDFDWGARRGPLPADPAREPSKGSFRGARPDFGDGGDRPRRAGYELSDGKERDFSNWERKGPLTPVLNQTAPSGVRAANDGPRERKDSPAWGEGRSNDGSRPPRREFTERPMVPERAPTAAELDNQWRTKMRPDAPAVTSPTVASKDTSSTTSPSSTPAIVPISNHPATRPKLNLQKRTVSTSEPSPALPTGGSDAKSSPFGAARPIDTTQRDKEIEEKRQHRKEQEDKVREEKRLAAEEKAKEAKRPVERSERPKPKTNGQPKEGDAQEAADKNYQILKREAGETESQAGDHEPTGNAISPEVEKNVKPQEIVKSSNGDAPESTDKLEEDGWSTVSKPIKGKKGGSVTRAIAS